MTIFSKLATSAVRSGARQMSNAGMGGKPNDIANKTAFAAAAALAALFATGLPLSTVKASSVSEDPRKHFERQTGI